MRNNGSIWTTVSMIAVFFIIAWLVLSLIESAWHPRRSWGESDYCNGNLKRLTNAMLLYYYDYDAFPQHLSQLTLGPYEGSDRNFYFTCSVNNSVAFLPVSEIDEHTDYLYRPPTTIGDTLPILADKLSNHRFEPINVAFADWRVEAKELSLETIAFMADEFGDTSFSQEQIDYINRSDRKIALDNVVAFIKDHSGTFLSLLFLLVTVSMNIAARMAVNRYKKKYHKTPTWNELEAWIIIRNTTQFFLWIAIIFTLWDWYVMSL